MPETKANPSEATSRARALLDQFGLVDFPHRGLIRDLIQRVETLETALRPSYVLLEGLRRGVEWELAPPIKKEIARVAELARAALAAEETPHEG